MMTVNHAIQNDMYTHNKWTFKSLKGPPVDIFADVNLRYTQIIWKNGSFKNRENLKYKKTAVLALLSLFIRTNGKCSNFHGA